MERIKEWAGKLVAIWIIPIATITLFSCVGIESIVYTQPESLDSIKQTFNPVPVEERKIDVDDELFIRVSNFNEGANLFTQLGGDFVRNENTNLVSYTVNENGKVLLPYVGEIYVEDLTLAEASDRIEEALSSYLNQPTVFLKFINKYVTVIGEVSRPGRYNYQDEYINIFQALAFAGDITYYGNRQSVMIVRENYNSITRKYIDLTDQDLFESDYYFLKPNDIVYVKPLKQRKWGIETFPYDLILSSLTFAMLVLTFVLNNP